MDFLDPTNEASWKNYPAPYLDPSLVAEVEGMLGRNVFGQPNLRFAWGQTEMKFQRGKERLKYVDKRIPPVEHTQHVLKRATLFDDSGKAIQWEKQICAAQPKVIPEGWLYELELVDLEFIGDQLFYIEQYVPADRLGDTPESWEAIRYEDWEDPELGFVAHCDVLGPFPSEGQYRDVFAIGEKYVYPIYNEGRRSEGEYLRFQMPGADTVEALREKLFRRENEVLPSAAKRGKDRFENYKRGREDASNRNAIERKAFFRDALSTTGKREALARTIGKQAQSPPVSVNVPLEFPKEQLFNELQKLNRRQRRAQESRERKAA